MKQKQIFTNSKLTEKAAKNGKRTDMFVNSTALVGGEWEMISPYGDFPSADRKRTQSFHKPQAEAMVATFNSLWHKVGTLFRGVPIYHGHPDIDPKNWADDRRLGKVVELEAREDGLWGKPEYNSLGKENADEGWWVYPSPTWLSPQTNSRTVLPDELMSIGLVNNPNIFESQPWTNSADQNETKKDEKMNREQICALLGLDPTTATDEEIFAGIKQNKEVADANAAEATKKADAEKAEADKVVPIVKPEPTPEEVEAKEKREAEEKAEAEKEAEKKAAKETQANALKVAADVVVDSAIAKGSITEADREVTTNSLLVEGGDFKKLTAELITKTASLNTSALKLGDKKVAISNSRERGAVIQDEVNKRMDANSMNYEAAYKSVKNDPKFKAVFDAMKKPGEAAQ